MEQVRALPFSTLAAGLDRTDLASADPNITVAGSGPTAVYTFTPTNETIPTGTSGAAQVPLNPHRQTKVINEQAERFLKIIAQFKLAEDAQQQKAAPRRPPPGSRAREFAHSLTSNRLVPRRAAVAAIGSGAADGEWTEF